jgi:hypothetical protein
MLRSGNHDRVYISSSSQVGKGFTRFAVAPSTISNPPARTSCPMRRKVLTKPSETDHAEKIRADKRQLSAFRHHVLRAHRWVDVMQNHLKSRHGQQPVKALRLKRPQVVFVMALVSPQKPARWLLATCISRATSSRILPDPPGARVSQVITTTSPISAWSKSSTKSRWRASTL